MQSALSLSLSSPFPITRSDCSPTPQSLRFCGVRKEALEARSSFNTSSLRSARLFSCSKRSDLSKVFAVLNGNGKPSPSNEFDYDLVIIGAGVGGHGAALHAVEKYDRQGVADHANNLASKIRSNLTNSLKALGVEILTGSTKVEIWQRRFWRHYHNSKRHNNCHRFCSSGAQGD